MLVLRQCLDAGTCTCACACIWLVLIRHGLDTVAGLDVAVEDGGSAAGGCSLVEAEACTEGEQEQ